MSPVISVGLLLLCAVFAQAFKSPGGGGLMEDDKDMWGDTHDLMDRDELPAKMTKATIPGLCSVCKKIITKVKAKLNGNEAKENITKMLNSVCDRMMLVKSICKNVVNKYKDKLIDAIAKHSDPGGVCKALSLCK
ncbi:antimicrobial peptide NK-lysin-like [Esox lucius]|uniref:Saposin B-type domain-containing protein n=1 Tax=Esox lucius TaxID=8010 RepID=A0AAY5KGZ6_ESOLU|nr:antimicrobial peptide NK-lysin-like [Esox lucius]